MTTKTLERIITFGIPMGMLLMMADLFTMLLDLARLVPATPIGRLFGDLAAWFPNVKHSDILSMVAALTILGSMVAALVFVRRAKASRLQA